jgi:hypothetical protein
VISLYNDYPISKSTHKQHNTNVWFVFVIGDPLLPLGVEVVVGCLNSIQMLIGCYNIVKFQTTSVFNLVIFLDA